MGKKGDGLSQGSIVKVSGPLVVAQGMGDAGIGAGPHRGYIRWHTAAA
nr:hypothetical protein [Mahella sp.]